jgi:predicted transcriptional regulator
MQVSEIISDLFPAVRMKDIGEKALERMDFFKVSHMPLIDDTEYYCGIISENEIYDFDLMKKNFLTHKNVLIRPFVQHNSHIYDAVNLFAEFNLSLVPVIDHSEKYRGSILMNDIVKYLGSFSSMYVPGTVFVLEMSISDYLASQISQIIEGNDAKILSMHVRYIENSTRMEVIVKVNTHDFSAIRQTFERYSYTIKEAYTQEDKMNELIEERYLEFMNYLSI